MEGGGGRDAEKCIRLQILHKKKLHQIKTGRNKLKFGQDKHYSIIERSINIQKGLNVTSSLKGKDMDRKIRILSRK